MRKKLKIALVALGIICTIATLSVFAQSFLNSKRNTTSNQQFYSETSKIDTFESQSNKIYKLKFGELLDSNINGNTLIIKAKISPSYSNKSTISQNGYNVEDIILNQGGNSFDEIQYWAIADMENGSEDKVISFTLNKDQITAIKNKQLVGNKIIDNASDVWILPSLLK